MQEKYRMKNGSLFCIALSLTLSRGTGTYPRIFKELSASAATLSSAICGAAFFLILFALLSLAEKTRKKDLLTLAEKKFGGAAKYFLFALIFIFLIYSSAITLRETGEFIKTASLPQTPLWQIMLFLAAAAVICASQGFCGIGNAYVLIIPSVAFAIALLGIFGARNGEISYLFPRLGFGIKSTLRGGLYSLGLYSDFIVLLLLSPFAAEQKSLKKTLLFGALCGIIINILTVFALNLSAPYTAPMPQEPPLLCLLRRFSLGSFFRRADGYFIFLLSMGSILSLSLNIFFAAYSSKAVFRLPRLRLFSYPIGALLFFLAILPKSLSAAYSIEKNTLWACFFLLALCAFLVLALPKIKRRNKK